jgi:tRNA splicing endonuclease
LSKKRKGKIEKKQKKERLSRKRKERKKIYKKKKWNKEKRGGLSRSLFTSLLRSTHIKEEMKNKV